MYSGVHKSARFCPGIFREISMNYFCLKTNLSKSTFESYFPVNKCWKNAGFAY
jgi:hypothetical protein